jgi:2'-5' RNA ligase
MRLFLAIPLPSHVRNELYHLQQQLKAHAKSGRFTPMQRMHITLFFFAKVNAHDFQVLENVLLDFEYESFSVALTHLDFFYRRGGHLSYCAIEKHEKLMDLHAQLKTALLENGIDFDQKKFNPHITLARQIQLNNDHDIVLPNVDIEPLLVNRLILYQSHQVKGVLTYTPLVEVKLQ